MRNDKVECQCCKRMMVPRVVMERPMYVDGVPFGGDRPLKTFCPFCMSEEWDGNARRNKWMARFRRDVSLCAQAMLPELLLLAVAVIGVIVWALSR